MTDELSGGQAFRQATVVGAGHRLMPSPHALSHDCFDAKTSPCHLPTRDPRRSLWWLLLIGRKRWTMHPSSSATTAR